MSQLKTELECLRKICLSQPGAIEKMSHGTPTWFTKPKGKWFAVFDNNHHSQKHLSVWIPVPKEVQEGLVSSEPARYWVPPYVGVKGWVAIDLTKKPNWKTVAGLIEQAFLFAQMPTLRRR